MNFQEAQTRFEQCASRVTETSTTADIQAVKADLSALLRELPNTEEFDPIAGAIAELQPLLSDRVTVQIVERIQARSSVLQGAASLLKQTSDKARSSASTLSLERTRLVLPALSTTVEQIRAIQTDLQSGRQSEALLKAESLVTMLGQVRVQLGDSD